MTIHQYLMKACQDDARQPRRAPPPALLILSIGGSWKRWSPGPAANSSDACGTGSA